MPKHRATSRQATSAFRAPTVETNGAQALTYSSCHVDALTSLHFDHRDFACALENSQPLTREQTVAEEKKQEADV